MKADKSNNENETYELFKSEVRALYEANHPNILRLHNYSRKEYAIKPNGKKSKVTYIALEYAPNGELFDYVSESGRFSESVCRFYFRQLIDAMEYMNERGFSHRDIKLENILLDEKFNLKLADFGFTTKNKVSTTRKGTVGYMAPEVMAKVEYDSKVSDIFSAGVVLFIMYTKFCPFINVNKNDIYYSRILKKKWHDLWELYDTSCMNDDLEFTPEFKDLFQQMMDPNPADRITIDRIKSHEWMNGPIATSDEIFEEFNRRKILIETKKQDSTIEPQSNVSMKDANPEEIKEPFAQPTSITLKDKKYTKFFNNADPEDLVSAVVQLATNCAYGFLKSDDFFRVDMRAVEDDETADIIVNILKKPTENSRCIQLIKADGSDKAFLAAFENLKCFLENSQQLC